MRPTPHIVSEGSSTGVAAFFADCFSPLWRLNQATIVLRSGLFCLLFRCWGALLILFQRASSLYLLSPSIGGIIGPPCFPFQSPLSWTGCHSVFPLFYGVDLAFRSLQKAASTGFLPPPPLALFRLSLVPPAQKTRCPFGSPCRLSLLGPAVLVSCFDGEMFLHLTLGGIHLATFLTERSRLLFFTFHVPRFYFCPPPLKLRTLSL